MSYWTNRLFPHQREAVDKLARLKVGALFMEMGTGKTLTALHIFDKKIQKNKVDKLIWFCPVSAKHDINQQIKEQQSRYSCVEVLPQIKPVQADIYIIGTESISHSDSTYLLADEMVNERTMIVVDESHMIKNYKSKRTIRIMRFGRKCACRYVMTGTPMGLGIEDLYSQIRFLSPKIFDYSSYREFEQNHILYRKNQFPKRVYKRINEDYLLGSLEPYAFRVKKEECIKIKAKCFYTRRVDLSTRERLQYDEIKYDVLTSPIMETAPGFGIFKLFSKLHQFTCTKVQDKQQVLNRIVEELGEDKCIIWCSYLKEVEAIKNLLPNSVKLTGEVKDKAGAIDDFKNKKQFLIATFGCGSTGLNLAFCNNAIFYSNRFDALVRQQAEDRIHRIGQENQVKIFDVAVANTIDYVIFKCIKNKRQLIDLFDKDLIALKRAKNQKERKNILKKIGDKL
jgi:SNF2 family DNA or RNA helicase